MYQVLECREEGSELGRESRNRTVYKLLFGRVCADANGIGEEVSPVPADLREDLGIKTKSFMESKVVDLRVEPYIPGQIASLVGRT